MTSLGIPLTSVRDWRARSTSAVTVGACIVGPLLVYAIVVGRDGHFLSRAIEGSAAIAVVAIAARRPAAAVGVMLFFIPFQQVILSLILREHAPVPIVRGLGGVKDIVVLGVAVAAINATAKLPKRVREAAHNVDGAADRHFDAIDKFLLTYLVLATIYLLVPRIATGGAATQSTSVRLLAWRTDTEFAVLLFALRRVPVTALARRRIENSVLFTAALVAAGGVYEYFDPTAFNRFLTSTLQIPRYQVLVLGIDVIHANTLEFHGIVAGTAIVRIGSVLVDPTVLGFYLLVGLALALRRLSEHRAGLSWLIVLLIGATIVLSLTRSAVLGAGVVLVVMAAQVATRVSPGRVRVALVLTVVALAAVPLSSATNLTARSESALAGTDTSSQGHGTDLERGLKQIVHEPLGAGLGTVAGIGDRFDVSDKVTSENAYVQVGDELGVLTLIAFAGFLIAAAVKLRRRARLPGADGREGAAALGIVAAFIIGGFFQEIWLDFSTALSAAAVIALALPTSSTSAPSSNIR